MLSMARAEWEFGLPGASRTAGSRESRPSSNARRRPPRSGRVIFTQVKRRPNAPKECPSEHHTRESLRRISGAAPVKPAFVDILVRIDLDRGEVRMSQHGNALLTFVLQQSIRPVDVGAHDQRVVPARLQNVLDTEGRSSSVPATLLDRNLYSGEKIFDVLASGTRVHQQEQVDAVAGGELDAGEESRRVFQARGGLLQFGDTCGRVVIGDSPRHRDPRRELLPPTGSNQGSPDRPGA